MKENITTYSLAKEIKLESDQASGSSCKFSRNTEHITTYSTIPQGSNQQNPGCGKLYRANPTIKLHGEEREGKKTCRLK